MDKKILLVADDEEMNRMIIRKFLKNEYEIVEAENGQKVMDILKERHIDAILLDIIMPELDGLEVLKLVKEDREFRHIGILVATATKEKTEREALSLGADDIVSKPYDPIVIKKRMENILAMKEVKLERARLQNKDSLTLHNEKDIKIMHKIRTSVDKVDKCADIISMNKDNVELLDEIISEIKLQVKQILDEIQTED